MELWSCGAGLACSGFTSSEVKTSATGAYGPPLPLFPSVKTLVADRCRAQRKRRGFCHNQIPVAATRGTAMKRVKSAAGGICATGP